MKTIKHVLLLIGVLGIAASCSKDNGYSLNDMWLTTGTVIKTSDYYYIVTDGEDALWPSASNVDPNYLEDSARVLVNYTILSDAESGDKYDYYVKVNAVQNILTKPVFEFTAETEQAVKDSIGNDPIYIKSAWIKDDYLTVEFEFGGGYEIHFINLVYDETEAETDNGELILELKHNKNGDEYNYKQWGLASFHLTKLQKEGADSVNILLRSITSTGEYDYNKILNYDYSRSPESVNTTKSFKLETMSKMIE